MTAPLAIPAELKKITQFVRRAEELDKDTERPESRLVAYYCRQFAVTSGIELSNSGAAKACLSKLLTTLETEKQAMGTFTRDESLYLCRKFAIGVFEKADAEDRAGLANKNTARSFYASAVFLEILQQFSGDVDSYTEDLQEEDKQKRMYSKWKATEIIKAIKEGRGVAPGGFGEAAKEEEAGNEPQPQPQPQADGVESGVVDEAGGRGSVASFSEPVDDSSHNDVSAAAASLPPMDESPPVFDDAPPPFPPSEPPVSPSSKTAASKSSSSFGMFGKSGGKSKGRVSSSTMDDVIELTRFALSALESRDVDLGTKRLEEALSQLHQH